MNRSLLLFPFITCLLGGCCGACGQFWTEVKQGMYYEAEPFARMQKVVSLSFPKTFTSTGRVILRRGSGENAFTLRLQVDSVRGEMRLAGLTDLGNVIFSALSDRSGVRIVKNNSGWPDAAISDAIIPACRHLTMLTLSQDCIIQKMPSERWLYRSVNVRGEVEEVELNDAGDRVSVVRLRRFSLFGEKEALRRIRIVEYGQSGQEKVPYPKRFEILDEISGYRAEVSIRNLKLLP